MTVLHLCCVVSKKGQKPFMLMVLLIHGEKTYLCNCLVTVGASLIPYGLPCLRELFRFLISLTNPHDRHNTDTMMHMGLQLLTVALESAHIANYQSLLVLVKDELCRHLFQVK